MPFRPSGKGRKRQKKGGKGQFRPISGKGSQTPLKPPFVTPPFAATQLKLFGAQQRLFPRNCLERFLGQLKENRRASKITKERHEPFCAFAIARMAALSHQQVAAQPQKMVLNRVPGPLVHDSILGGHGVLNSKFKSLETTPTPNKNGSDADRVCIPYFLCLFHNCEGLLCHIFLEGGCCVTKSSENSPTPFLQQPPHTPKLELTPGELVQIFFIPKPPFGENFICLQLDLFCCLQLSPYAYSPLRCLLEALSHGKQESSKCEQ